MNAASMTAAAMAGRLRRQRIMVGVLAVVSSVMLHIVAVMYFPEQWLISTASDPQTEPDKFSFNVDIDPDQWLSTVDMERLRIVSSAMQPDGTDALELEQEQRLDPAALEPDTSPETLADDEALAAEDGMRIEPVVEIGPGQKILEITERAASEPETAFRDAIRPLVERVDDAPDLIVPGAAEELRERAAVAGSTRASGLMPGDLPDIGEDTWAPRFADLPELGFAPGASGIEGLNGVMIEDGLGASDGAASPVTAVDRHLRLRARQFQSSRRADHVYVEILIERHEGDDLRDEPFLDVLPRDLVFIQDLSGSMGARRVVASRQGIANSLQYLSDADRFNIVTYSDEIKQYADNWAPAGAQAAERAQPFFDDMVSGGMTDIQAALNLVLDLELDPQRATIAILLTDGLPPNVGETNTTRIIEDMTIRNRGNMSFFSVSTGWWDHMDESYLLDMLAYRNRGDALMVRGEMEGMTGLIEKLAVELSRPVLTDLRYRFTHDSESEVYPVMLPNLYLDRTLALHVRVPRNRQNLAFQVVGRSGQLLYDFVFDIPLDDVPPGSQDIRAQWARHRMYYLISEHMRSANVRVLRELFDTANRYGLEIPYLDDFTEPSRLRFWQ